MRMRGRIFIIAQMIVRRGKGSRVENPLHP
jgi:hypothetical protein